MIEGSIQRFGSPLAARWRRLLCAAAWLQVPMNDSFEVRFFQRFHNRRFGKVPQNRFLTFLT